MTVKAGKGSGFVPPVSSATGGETIGTGKLTPANSLSPGGGSGAIASCAGANSAAITDGAAADGEACGGSANGSAGPAPVADCRVVAAGAGAGAD